jgi:DNA-binding NtrC family response regulator
MTMLRQTNGRVGETARLAGMRARALFDKMKRHGLHKEDFRAAGPPGSTSAPASDGSNR